MRHTTALWQMLKIDCKELMFTERYTTEEALQEAAKSYGGLTPKPFLSPG